MSSGIEKPCGIEHNTLEDALRHTHLSLVGNDKSLLPDPYWGTRTGKIGNIGKVLGWQSADRLKRWRLDYDPVKGVHINEEDFSCEPARKTCHKVNISQIMASTYINKWTSRYDKPAHVIEAEREHMRQIRDGFR